MDIITCFLNNKETKGISKNLLTLDAKTDQEMFPNYKIEKAN
jgi:hypothetical protein